MTFCVCACSQSPARKRLSENGAVKNYMANKILQQTGNDALLHITYTNASNITS